MIGLTQSCVKDPIKIDSNIKINWQQTLLDRDMFGKKRQCTFSFVVLITAEI